MLSALFGQEAGQGFITFAALHPWKLAPYFMHVPQRAKPISIALDKMAEANQQEFGISIGIATRRPGLTKHQLGGLGDLIELTAIFADIDEPRGIERRLEMACYPTPSIQVNSGKGRHLYWLLESPTGDWKTAARIMRAFADKLGGCPIGPSQPMRLPGTVNTKPGRGSEARIIQLDTACRYKLRELAEHVPPPRIREPIEHEEEDKDLREIVADRLLAAYQGRYKEHWIISLCPYGHSHDHPGKHFTYDPQTGVGHCFGAHGFQSTRKIADQLGIAY